ncbi:interleukin-17C-like [Protopterus annectens]|uniref:interleukin-17C-like n=1 Tax=Protopterus annectens TaxID=7888 RepID=UPI001CF9BD47|nr:interleukin-17C-like [Protopterus annectens]
MKGEESRSPWRTIDLKPLDLEKESSLECFVKVCAEDQVSASRIHLVSNSFQKAKDEAKVLNFLFLLFLAYAVNWTDGNKVRYFDLSHLNENAHLLRHLVGNRLSWDRYPSVFLVEQLDLIEETRGKRARRHLTESCPTLNNPYRHHHHHLGGKKDLSSRSISPWTYRIDVDETRYPEKLAFAECLCKGCIDITTGEESSSMNSVVLEQTMMVLRKKTCSTNKNAYTFETDYIKVPVGCTCVLPKMKM